MKSRSGANCRVESEKQSASRSNHRKREETCGESAMLPTCAKILQRERDPASLRAPSGQIV